MKKMIGVTVVLVTLFLSANAFAGSFIFEVDGKEYLADSSDTLKEDGSTLLTWKEAMEACPAPRILPSDAILDAMLMEYEYGFADLRHGSTYWSSSGQNRYIVFNDGGNMHVSYDRDVKNVRCVQEL